MNDTSRNAQDKTNTMNNAEPGTQDASSTAGAANGTGAASPTDAAAKGGEADLVTQLSEAQAKANEYLDGWQRSRADFANYKKRADRERDDAYQNGSVETLRKLLPIIDDFDRAAANLPQDLANKDSVKGLILIHRKLVGLLDGTGIKVINPVGEVFNPAFHEAIGQDESSNVPSGHITTVLQKGYVYGDKVLRPAMVRVSA